MQKFLLFAFALLTLSACNDSDSDEIRFATENTAIADGSLTGINLHFLGTSAAPPPTAQPTPTAPPASSSQAAAKN